MGQGSIFGPNEHIVDEFTTCNYLYDDNLNKKLGELNSKRTTLGHDVWIGARVVVLKGVSISTGAILGAGSVVTKNIPAYAIAVGIPAKIVGYRFSPDMITNLVCSKWWEYDSDNIKNAIKTATEMKNTISQDVQIKNILSNLNKTKE